MIFRTGIAAMVASAAFAILPARLEGQDPLPSWREGKAKTDVLQFVSGAVKDGPGFVPEQERIAVFDNDGTLWPENPLPFQLIFAIDQLKAMADGHPEWKDDKWLAAALNGDSAVLKEDVHAALNRILVATHAGITTDEFEKRVRSWLKEARHPRFNRPYNELGYRPMIELLQHLRANRFRTYIVSGGGVDFMRIWAEEAYGIPPEQVIGSIGKLKFDFSNPVPVLIKEAGIAFIDDKSGKPVAIHRQIGRRPVAAFGNSDGDKQMLEWTTVRRRPAFGLLVHHTDAEREYAYDANPSSSGKLVAALQDAPKRSWVVVDMKRDWKVIFSDAKGEGKDMKASKALFGTTWWAEDIGGRGVVDRSHSTLLIAEDGGVSGDGGVNRYRGKATLQSDSIKFGPMAVTRRAGPEALMNQETRFLKALSDATSIKVGDDKLLHVYDTSGKEILRFWASQE